MAISILENFYKVKLTKACGAGAENIYVTSKPTPTNGWLVISPKSESLREIIRYTEVGTDGDGDFVTVTNEGDRGLGGTTAQAHAVGEPIRMNYTAEHQKEIDTTIEAIINAGSPLATTTVKGRVKLSVAPADANEPEAVGDNDQRLNATTGLTADQEGAISGGGNFGTPSGTNKFLTEKFLDTTVNVQEFTTSGTWTKPSLGKFALVKVWGGGGGGGNGISDYTTKGAGSGGGGGGYSEHLFNIDDLGATETVTIGAGGAATIAGGDTTFGSHLTGKGGSAGLNGVNNGDRAGGNGGGIGLAHSQGGGVGIANAVGGASEWGGGAGGGTTPGSGKDGGQSKEAGGGGGAGGTLGTAGGAGGSKTRVTFSAGGGGAGGANRVDGSNGSTEGYGGGGGGSRANGGNGGLFAGGGGGGHGDSLGAAGLGGAGGAGKVIVTVF